MQVICTLALHHPLTAVSYEVILRYVEQMQHSSLLLRSRAHIELYDGHQYLHSTEKQLYVIVELLELSFH